MVTKPWVGEDTGEFNRGSLYQSVFWDEVVTKVACTRKWRERLLGTTRGDWKTKRAAQQGTSLR